MTYPTPLIPCAWGELIDKITILEIKNCFVTDPQKRKIVAHELETLMGIAQSVLEANPAIKNLKNNLYQTNSSLWTIEDEIRLKERDKNFDDEFVALARSVYITNDKRADLKHQINSLLKSEFSEVKNYKPY